MSSSPLEEEFLNLLEKDRKFRLAVASYLGYDEILRRLIEHDEKFNLILGEVRSLREGQNRLWENQNRLWEEVRSLREDQVKLWENQNRLWEEVRALRVEYERMRKYMVSGFRDLSRALGVSFEDHAASFLELTLEEMGYAGARVERKYLAHDGEVIEINLFCEEPLVVGEAKVSIRSIEDAEMEVKKLMERVKIVEEKYGKKPLLTILSVARPTVEASGALRSLAEERGIKLILGREIEESLSI